VSESKRPATNTEAGAANAGRNPRRKSMTTGMLTQHDRPSTPAEDRLRAIASKAFGKIWPVDRFRALMHAIVTAETAPEALPWEPHPHYAFRVSATSAATGFRYDIDEAPGGYASVEIKWPREGGILRLTCSDTERAKIACEEYDAGKRARLQK
jgi:hypothetical protein